MLSEFQEGTKTPPSELGFDDNTNTEDLKFFYDNNYQLRSGTQDMDCQEIEVANNPEKSYIKVNPLEKEYKDTFIADYSCIWIINFLYSFMYILL